MATQEWNATAAAPKNHNHTDYALANHGHSLDDLAHEHPQQITVSADPPANPTLYQLWIPLV